MDKMHASAETEIQIFPWSEFLTLVGFTIILVIEIFHGGQNKKEVSRSSKGNTTAGTISCIRADISRKVFKSSTFISNNFNCVQNFSCFGG